MCAGDEHVRHAEEVPERRAVLGRGPPGGGAAGAPGAPARRRGAAGAPIPAPYAPTSPPAPGFRDSESAGGGDGVGLGRGERGFHSGDDSLPLEGHKSVET